MKLMGMFESVATASRLKPDTFKPLLPPAQPLTKETKTIQQEAEAWVKKNGFHKATNHDHDHIGHPGKAHSPTFLGELNALTKTNARHFWDAHGNLPTVDELHRLKNQTLETIKMARNAHTADVSRRFEDLEGVNKGFTLPASDFFEFNVHSPTPPLSDAQFKSVAQHGLNDLALDLAVNGTPKAGNWLNTGGRRRSLKEIPNIQNVSAKATR